MVRTFIVSIVKIQLLLLGIMTLFRAVFYVLFTPYSSLPHTLYGDLAEAFWFGCRLDASILGYIGILSLLIVLGVFWGRLRAIRIRKIVHVYFFLIGVSLSAMAASDMAFYSYFGEHANIMIFGVFDDDTMALLEVAVKNYNLPLLFTGSILYLAMLWLAITALLPQKKRLEQPVNRPTRWENLFIIFLIALSFLMARGSFGHFPISKNTIDVSSDPFINILPQNGVYALVKSYTLYQKSKAGNVDLIKKMGFSDNIQKAFEIHTGKQHIDPKNMLASLEKTTPHNPALKASPPHVVVIMVESFGLPITAYQSPQFDILGRLKKHFDEDTLFTHFLSGSNGTIVSMEPFLLNIAARPNTTSFAQSMYMQTPFKQAAARVYQNHGYETSFIYGGDLSWRNVGVFMKYQGFDHVEGKGSMIGALINTDKTKMLHTWGVYDQYAYDYLIQKLSNSTKPQFIYLMTTNNHPPYEIPSDYVSRPLKWPAKLTEHMNGDRALLEKRLHDYAYALDMAGRFMDTIKSDPKLSNTVVVITADNNTIESNMIYEDTVSESKRIPFYLYLPKSLKPHAIDSTIPGSHKDVFATLYPLTLSDAKYISTGVNMLDPHEMHCGFNDADIILSKDGGFKVDKPKTKEQELCNRYYKATLATGEYLIRSHDKK